MRGGILPDGTIVKTGEVLWQNNQLDDLTTNPMSQGDLKNSTMHGQKIVGSPLENTG